MADHKVGKMEKVKILKKIAEVISSFNSEEFFENSINLFNVLGYNTSRQSRLDKPGYIEFEQRFLEQHNDITDIENFKKKAHVDKWEEIDLLFQITDAEMSNKRDIFDTGKFQNSEIYSYLFFAIELKELVNKNYSKTTFSSITRQINRVFSMPVIILFKVGESITLSIIKRRLNKKDVSRDVLEKVTLIKDINTQNPHRAHIEILFDLSLEQLQINNRVTNFTELQEAWRVTLDTTELNEKFYKEISSWYYWAIENVEFPDDFEKDREIRNSTAIIRLLTRLIFVWFLKEKVAPMESLFKKETLVRILKNFEKPEISKATIYYKAILQNLFFATLSTETKMRRFHKKKSNEEPDHADQYVYKYENLVSDVDSWKQHFRGIPFLNGGLFENLDDRKNNIKVDAFWDDPKNNLKVPDELFFSDEEKIDLNETFNTQGRRYKVKGLLQILNRYKFTIAENTPIEEEIALDPELLGKVFENLLASFNPETKTTARNQTGSFYTPREIVDYMVDESLKVSISNIVSKKIGNTTQEDIKTRLDILFAYTEEENPFSKNEVKEIVKAISEIKILDPACGSGAFPMGILHKLTFILSKLDHNNIFWRKLQEDRANEETKEAYKSGNREERRNRIIEIEEAFTANTSDDYGRKLFLIENAIYGVDIQPIAVQISKLRFFISLIVDQDFKYKIKPLPNLETKFVAADTLIGIIGEDTRDLFDDPTVTILEGLLRKVRHEHFRASTPKRKSKVRNTDRRLRITIAEHLEKNKIHGKDERGKQLKSWDPYDQNSHSSFFDSEWMYGITDGFDIVIGNPPYVQIQKFSGKQIQKDWQAENYETFQKTGDIYQLFYEKGNQLLKNQGVLCFITSNKWMRANYGKTTRKYLLDNVSILQLVDFGDSPIFENATTYTNILMFSKDIAKRTPLVWDLSKVYTKNMALKEILQVSASTEGIFSVNSFIIIPSEQAIVRKRIEEMGTALKDKDWDVLIYRGVLTGYNKAFIIPGVIKDKLIAQDPRSAEIIKPILRGRDIKKYKAEFADLWLINTHNGYLERKTQRRIPPIEINSYPAIKKHLEKHWEKLQNRQDKGITPYNLRNCAYLGKFEKEKIVWSEIVYDSAFSLDVSNLYPEATSFILTGQNLRYLIALLNSKLVTFAFRKFYAGGDLRGETFRYKKVFLENLPIPIISKSQQLPFEILVDCTLFAKENEMETEAGTFESVIDGMVYDFYFEKEMKEANCYITDRITEVVKPFKQDDSNEFKTEYIKKLHKFCRNDKTVFRGLIHRRNVRVVEIINGEK